MGIFIYLDDIGCVVLIAAAMILAVRTGHLSSTFCWPLLILLGLAILNFCRGVALYGVKPAGNGVRDLVYLILPIIAISAIQPARIGISRIALWLCGASLLFVAVGFLRWSGVLPIPEDVLGADEMRDVIRVLPADYAMLIGHALIAILAMQIIRGVRVAGLLMAACFGAILLVLQHRSVWTAIAVGIAWLAFRSLPRARAQWMHLASLVLAGATIASLLLVHYGYADKLISLLTLNVSETQQDDSTWSWRVNGFSEATERTFSAGALDAAIGPPAGNDLSGIADMASVHIHNRYISTLAYYGVIGVALFGIWLWLFAARIGLFGVATRYRQRRSPAAMVIEALFVAELTYFIAYSGGLLHGALLGMFWVAASQECVPAGSTQKNRADGICQHALKLQESV
jgi:hypothetical protein